MTYTYKDKQKPIKINKTYSKKCFGGGGKVNISI